MANLRLPAPLFDLLPAEEQSVARLRTVALRASSWAEVVDELRTRFPRLADHVLAPDGELRQGFVLVANDEVMTKGYEDLELAPRDEICVIAALAGGAG